MLDGWLPACLPAWPLSFRAQYIPFSTRVIILCRDYKFHQFPFIPIQNPPQVHCIGMPDPWTTNSLTYAALLCTVHTLPLVHGQYRNFQTCVVIASWVSKLERQPQTGWTNEIGALFSSSQLLPPFKRPSTRHETILPKTDCIQWK